jgi:hypothetical protein
MLSGCFWKREIDAGVVVCLACCFEVELIERNIAMMFVANVERGVCHRVVVNLLGRATVFEDKCDRILVGQWL